MNLCDQLVTVADLYAGATRRKRARVSTMVFNHGSRLDSYATGVYVPNLRTYENAMQWFSDNWPDIVEWPEGISRPAPKAAEVVGQ
jgi:hypothetical protein